MLRYSLGSLFLALLYLSIGCAALVNATGAWPQVAVTLTLAILVLVSLGAFFWTERRRVFAIGFAATGWLYFLLVFSDVTNVRPYLLTDSLTNQLFVTMHSKQMAQNIVYQTVMTATGPSRVQTAVYAAPPSPVRLAPSAAGNNTLGPVYTQPIVQPYPLATLPAYSPVAIRQRFVDPQSFANIGHSLWAVIIAFAGGITAQILAKRQKQVDVANTNESSPV